MQFCYSIFIPNLDPDILFSRRLKDNYLRLNFVVIKNWGYLKECTTVSDGKSKEELKKVLWEVALSLEWITTS